MLRTTYRCQGAGTKSFEYYTKHRENNGDVTVKGWGVYGPSSVLAGQSMKTFLGSFPSERECDAALAEAGINPAEVNWSNGYIEPVNTFNHLPDGPDW